LYKINVTTTEHTRLTTTGNATKPVWSPLENLIFYEWNIRGNKAFLIDLDSKEIFEVASDLEFEASPQWSISGTHLILFGRQNEGALTEIQFFNFENNLLLFAERVNNNPYLVKGRNFDWYYKENN
jgi:Tol biopolymer transport system component